MKITKQILETVKREFDGGKFQTTVQDLPFEIQFRLECSWGAALMHANRIRTTRFGCSCTVHTEPDVNGIVPWLELCPLHAHAEEMRETCSELVQAIETLSRYAPTHVYPGALVMRARALLRAIEGRETA